MPWSRNRCSSSQGLTGLWLAIGAFMVARLVALGLRARSPAWAVTGARRS
ncbi:MAG: hypothetical protein ACLPKE_04745 [Streptosporangiaceae bacterium]